MSRLPEEEKILERIGANCRLLYEGYYEPVEYTVPVAYHRNGCDRVPVTCKCPVTNERRSNKVKRPGYLRQLQEFAAHKDTDRNPKAERGAPRIKVAGRPPGDMAGFFAHDEIVCDIIATVDRVLEEVERDRTWAASPVHEILMALAGQVGHFIQARPDQARVIDKAAASWVAKARATLRISTGDAVFDSVLCGNCGGGLSTPWGNRGDHAVVCIGTPSDPPCGESYPMSEWVKLYEDHKRRASA